MNNNYTDYERYYYEDEMDCLGCDRSFSYARKRELEYRKYSAYDTFCGYSDDSSEER